MSVRISLSFQLIKLRAMQKPLWLGKLGAALLDHSDKLTFWQPRGIVLLACAFLLTGSNQAIAEGFTIGTEAEPRPLEKLAAKELVRYLYICSGSLPEVRLGKQPVDIRLLRKEDPRLSELGFRHDLAEQEYQIKSVSLDGKPTIVISGGSDQGLLYGVYRLIERLGVRFYLHGDVVPDERLTHLPELNDLGKPFFAIRGILPFHDFPEGPDWWDEDDYKSYLHQLAKLRMNFIGLHTYPEGGAGPEPLVWIGLKQDIAQHGEVTFSPTAAWFNTMVNRWGYQAAMTDSFVGGAERLFNESIHGPKVMTGLMPRPKDPAENNLLFNRSGEMLRQVFNFGRSLGIKSCIGTEAPLTIPREVKKHLTDLGKDPKNPAVVKELYEGIFSRIASSSPIDYYWLWTPEEWMWSGNNPENFEATRADITAAMQVLRDLEQPFELATSGWVLGPQNDRAALDKLLPLGCPMSSINPLCGHGKIDKAFANLQNRPKWASPWMENDPSLTVAQPWVGRLRYDAADARRLGCTGLIGIHWRTKAMAMNVSALAAAAWDQSWVPSTFDTTPLPPQTLSGAQGGTTHCSSESVAGTSSQTIFQSSRQGMSGYAVAIPNGQYTVELMFNESEFEEAGKRLFGLRIQGKIVEPKLDIYARSGGKNRALILTFPEIKVANSKLMIQFDRQVGEPCLSGIYVTGKTAAANQISGGKFSRKINCGGPVWEEFEADLGMGSFDPVEDHRRTLPVADFYADFARANFGESGAREIADLLSKIDGRNMPEPAGWGPGLVRVNQQPWDKESSRYRFVAKFEELRSQVKGSENLQRYDYWLNSFRGMRSMAELGCTAGALSRVIERINKETDPIVRQKIVRDEALPLRLGMTRLWERLLEQYLATVDTPGEMGTIANLETLSRQKNRILDKHDSLIEKFLGQPLSSDYQPSRSYSGVARIIVPTVRSLLNKGEKLRLKVIVLDAMPAKKVTLFWRRMGVDEKYSSVTLQHLGRSTYEALLPLITEDFEYYIQAVTASGQELLWPNSNPTKTQTVILW